VTTVAALLGPGQARDIAGSAEPSTPAPVTAGVPSETERTPAVTCAGCKAEIIGALHRAIDVCHRVTVLCERCCRETTNWHSQYMRDPRHRCRRCGREVWRHGYASYGSQTHCSRTCELATRRERRYHVPERRTECGSCGAMFTPPRSDGRYCSPACRQSAYRKRKAEP